MFDCWWEVGRAINNGRELKKARDTIIQYYHHFPIEKPATYPMKWVLKEIKSKERLSEFLTKYPDMLEFFI